MSDRKTRFFVNRLLDRGARADESIPALPAQFKCKATLAFAHPRRMSTCATAIRVVFAENGLESVHTEPDSAQFAGATESSTVTVICELTPDGAQVNSLVVRATARSDAAATELVQRVGNRLKEMLAQ